MVLSPSTDSSSMIEILSFAISDCGDRREKAILGVLCREPSDELGSSTKGLLFFSEDDCDRGERNPSDSSFNWMNL